MASSKKIFFFVRLVILLSPYLAFSPYLAEEQAAAEESMLPVAVSDAKKADTPEKSSPSQKTTTQIVVSVVVNTESKGDFFVELGDTGELFLKPEDLDTLKIKYPEGRTVLIREEWYVPLGAVLDVRYVFDEEKLTLSFIGKTTAAETTTADLFSLQARPRNIYYPRETSVFLNYGLNYAYTDSIGFQTFSATNTVGARTGDVFFVSDSLYTRTPTDAQFVRLQSSATFERRGELQWLVLGDQFANSGDLGSTMNMGGIGFSKQYKLDPYFITQPVFDLKGTTIFPTQAEVYLDGVLVGKQAIAPGSFQLKNLYSYNGAHNVELVLRDPFGNARRISYSEYFNTLMLREGLQEYSYNAGFLRKDYGLQSNDYDEKPAFSAFHRYGVTNSLNIAARAEGTDGVYNGGVSTQFTVSRLGAFSLSLAASDANGRKGSAGSFQHSYQFGSFNTSLLLRGFSKGYATVSAPTESADDQTRYDASIGAGFLLMPVGNLSFNYSENETYGGVKTRVTSANYSRGIANMTSLFATITETRQSDATTYSFFIGLNFDFGKQIHGAVQYGKTGNTDTESAQIQSDVPVGEGFGYRAALNRAYTGDTTSTAFNPFVQYNARYGIYSLDASVQNDSGKTTETYNLSAAGALVYAGGYYGLSRPVNDSFSIVMVDKVPNATVLNNGQKIGSTTSSGMMVVPTLTSYSQNHITLDVKNIPMDYSISGVNKAISPSLWSGSCIAFDAIKTQAITGTLFAALDGKKEPVEYREGTITIGTQSITFPTGKGGEFYIENALPKEQQEGIDRLSCKAIAERRATGGKAIKPGTYPAWIDYDGGKCEFSITFPETEDMFTEIGEVQCAMSRKAK